MSLSRYEMIPALACAGLLALVTAALPAAASDGAVMQNRSTASAKPSQEASGILVERVSLSAAGVMIDMRYRILDLEKAQKVLNNSARLMMIDQKTGAILPVPDMAKVGKLRQLPKNQEPSRIYWMFFRNTGGVVKQGSKLSLVMGDVKIKDIVVE